MYCWLLISRLTLAWAWYAFSPALHLVALSVVKSSYLCPAVPAALFVHVTSCVSDSDVV